MSALGDILGFEPLNVYISGPMRNRDGFNFPAFFEVENALIEQNEFLTIFNPAHADVVRTGSHDLLAEDPTGLRVGRYLAGDAGPVFDIRKALGEDMDFICHKADLLILLPEWEQSSGAMAEQATARALGITVVEWERLSAALGDPGRSLHTGEQPSGAPGGDSEALDAALAGVTPVDGLLTGEVRATSASGGQKGVKLAAFDQIDPGIEWEVAEHFGAGALKYDAHNFRRGYPWSQSYSALRRHLADFWAGKVYDTCPPDGHGCKHPEGFRPVRPNTCFNHTGSRHIVAVIWHAMALAEFSRYPQFKEYDDRYVHSTSD